MGISTPSFVRSRSQNFELNLVPFIDLMSVTAMFLLMTAVWTQVRDMPQRLEYTDFGFGAGPLDVRVSIDQIEVWRDYANRRTIPLLESGSYDWLAFNDLVRRARAAEPEQDFSVLLVDDGVPYQQMITAFDLLRAGGFLGTAIGSGSFTPAPAKPQAPKPSLSTCPPEP